MQSFFLLVPSGKSGEWSAQRRGVSADGAASAEGVTNKVQGHTATCYKRGKTGVFKTFEYRLFLNNYLLLLCLIYVDKSEDMSDES